MLGLNSFLIQIIFLKIELKSTMQKLLKLGFLSFSMLTFLGTGEFVSAQQSANIMVSNIWSRSTPPMAKNGAVYFTILNNGPADKLTGVSASVAQRSTLHRSKMGSGKLHGVMRMQGLSHIVLPGNQPFIAKPGGHHIMLMGLKKPLKLGDSFDLTLIFEKAGEITVTVSVQK
jgi:periplasmic copper chaperone A